MYIGVHTGGQKTSVMFSSSFCYKLFMLSVERIYACSCREIEHLKVYSCCCVCINNNNKNDNNNSDRHISKAA